MVDFFSSWAEQLIISIVISSIIEMILPDNKNKKYVKMVIGIYVLFTIISPFINKYDVFNLENFSLDSYAAVNTNISTLDNEKTNQTSMDDRLQELYIKELENNIMTKVKQEGYDVSSCKVDAILYGEKENQEIKKIDLVVSKKSENKSDNINNSEDMSNIKSVNKVEINVGLDKFLEDDKNSQAKSEDTQKLKNILSSYYEIDTKKINIYTK